MKGPRNGIGREEGREVEECTQGGSRSKMGNGSEATVSRDKIDEGKISGGFFISKNPKRRNPSPVSLESFSL